MLLPQNETHTAILRFLAPSLDIFNRFLAFQEYKTVKDLISTSFSEDISIGDITSQTTISENAYFTGTITARHRMVVAGLPIIDEILKTWIPGTTVYTYTVEGELVTEQMTLAELYGPARSLLIVERTVLNFLQHLSGIATLTQSYVERIIGTNATLLDTRKTIPGLRILDKYATRIGGACNHRFGLYDGILIKDNHIALCGNITSAVQSVKMHTAASIEVECDTLEQVYEAVDAGVDMVLLDNMPIRQLQRAVLLVNGQIKVEASGDITLDSVRSVAETGVDFISVGRITHSAPSADIGLDWKVL